MNKQKLLKIVNPIMAILILNQMLTGLLNDVLSHESFEFFHEGGGLLLIATSIIHVYLNWNWVKNNFLRTGRVK
ncbi:MAG: hypothetical protein JXR23_10460 [Pontiellaceae bacterium]|nr:hypothetical protein [Pontiellaceae bacterium]